VFVVADACLPSSCLQTDFIIPFYFCGGVCCGRYIATAAVYKSHLLATGLHTAIWSAHTMKWRTLLVSKNCLLFVCKSYEILNACYLIRIPLRVYDEKPWHSMHAQWNCISCTAPHARAMIWFYCPGRGRFQLTWWGGDAYSLRLILPYTSVGSFLPHLQPVFRFTLTHPMLLTTF
jgi:hypothetical protein